MPRLLRPIARPLTALALAAGAAMAGVGCQSAEPAYSRSDYGGGYGGRVAPPNEALDQINAASDALAAGDVASAQQALTAAGQLLGEADARAQLDPYAIRLDPQAIYDGPAYDGRPYYAPYNAPGPFLLGGSFGYGGGYYRGYRGYGRERENRGNRGGDRTVGRGPDRPSSPPGPVAGPIRPSAPATPRPTPQPTPRPSAPAVHTARTPSAHAVRSAPSNRNSH